MYYSTTHTSIFSMHTVCVSKIYKLANDFGIALICTLCQDESQRFHARERLCSLSEFPCQGKTMLPIRISMQG